MVASITPPPTWLRFRYRFALASDGDGARRVIYVTDAGQANHFAGVFQVAKRANWIPEHGRLEHVPFGLVQGEDGKKLKTRSGDTVPAAGSARRSGGTGRS
jgi:arginyl-tRNA synthetase